MKMENPEDNNNNKN